MAQTLVEDRSYNLTGDDNINGKSLYYVKLTDSCLKAIEEYIIHKVCYNILYLMNLKSVLFLENKQFNILNNFYHTLRHQVCLLSRLCQTITELSLLNTEPTFC